MRMSLLTTGRLDIPRPLINETHTGGAHCSGSAHVNEYDYVHVNFSDTLLNILLVSVVNLHLAAILKTFYFFFRPILSK